MRRQRQRQRQRQQQQQQQIPFGDDNKKGKCNCKGNGKGNGKDNGESTGGCKSGVWPESASCCGAAIFFVHYMRTADGDRDETFVKEMRETIMIDAPRITQTISQLTANLHLTVPRAEIRNVMGPGLSEVRAAIAAQGVAAAGPWFTHHLKMDPGVFDFEICVPVATPFTATGRVELGRWPATTVARTVYHGGYEGLGSAWGEFDRWIAARGYTPRPDLLECYVVGPESGADASGWRTELNRPLVD